VADVAGVGKLALLGFCPRYSLEQNHIFSGVTAQLLLEYEPQHCPGTDDKPLAGVWWGCTKEHYLIYQFPHKVSLIAANNRTELIPFTRELDDIPENPWKYLCDIANRISRESLQEAKESWKEFGKAG